MNDIDELLAKYKDGLPNMKPDVLQQIKEIEAEREKEKQQAIDNLQNTNITIQQQGHPPRKLTTNQVIELIQNQQKTIHDQKQIIDKLNSRGIITENNKGEQKLLSLEEIVSMITELKTNIHQLINKNEYLEKNQASNSDNTIYNVNKLTQEIDIITQERNDLQRYIKELQEDIYKLKQ